MNPTWQVRVYDGESLIDSWQIENRNEHEAANEAMADIGRDYPDSSDWTMLQI
jgi:hypothetical protein